MTIQFRDKPSFGLTQALKWLLITLGNSAILHD